MFATVRHILPVTTIQRERLLPVPGRVLVRRGQKVSPTDVVAETIVSPKHMILDIARGLGKSRAEAERLMQRQSGDEVAQGDVIAGEMRSGRRVIRAPQAGKIAAVWEGRVLLELQGRRYEMKAGYSGVVTDLVPDRGVVIETTGALIQGAWGNGRMDYGLLMVLTEHANDEITPNRLDVSMRGSVVLGGYCDHISVLKAAGELALRGLILSSLRTELAPAAIKCPCPVVVLEGFGRMPMNSAAFKLLSTSQRRDTSVIGDIWNPLIGSRPEIFISLPADSGQNEPQPNQVFRAGQRVRSVRAPYQGEVGSILVVHENEQVLSTGIKAPVAEVQLENGEKSVFPLANLEVLG